VADVADHLGLTEEEIVEGLEGARAYQAVSWSARPGASSATLSRR